jgi:hypothetical protein
LCLLKESNAVRIEEIPQFVNGIYTRRFFFQIASSFVLGTPTARAQPFPDTENFNQNDINDVAVLQNTSTSKPQHNNDRNYLDILTGICREGWVRGVVNGVTVCLRTNTELLPWREARDTCRKDFSFLVKMEAPIRIKSVKLEDYLKAKSN